jgi:hypothetical protein
MTNIMKSDEKNQFSSNKNDIDPDMRRDKYEELKKDKNFQQSDKRKNNYTHDEEPEDFEAKIIQHDPNNQTMKDLDR